MRARDALFPNTKLYRHLQIRMPLKSLTHMRPDRSHRIINSSDTYPVIVAKRKSVFEPATAWSCLFHCKLIRSSMFWEQYRAVSSLHIAFGCWTLTSHVMISIYDFWGTRRKYSLSNSWWPLVCVRGRQVNSTEDLSDDGLTVRCR